MAKKTQSDEAWIATVTTAVKAFCREYKVIYAVKARERAASFEIGCLHMLLTNYEQVGKLLPMNLNEKGEFRYLTSPNGNPENFSWIQLSVSGRDFQIRQQVRVQSHWHNDIAFCPDIVVLKPDANVQSVLDEDFANGKRKFFSVKSDQVVSAHECKSLSPFPELLVSFLGAFQAAHRWYDPRVSYEYLNAQGIHPAPCLFIGGDSRPIQRRMIKALEGAFPINIVSGLHFGLFKMARENRAAKYLNDDMFAATPKPKSPRRRQLLLPNHEIPF